MIVRQSKHWNGDVINLQVTDAKECTIELRALMSANSSSQAFDLRCEVREKLIDFLQQEYPHALPRERTEITPNKPRRREHSGDKRRRRKKSTRG